LSLNNISAQDACRNVPITKSYNTGCFSAKSSITNQNSFSESNVSMYTEHYGSYTFCLTKFNLERKLDSDYFGVIKTGKSIISSETAVAVGNLERVCYNYGDSDSVIPSLQYRTYIGTTATIDPNNTILDSSDDISLVMNEPFKKKIQNGRYIKETYTMKFTLPRAFASNGTGKLGHGSCLLGKNCKYMGKSVLAKFNLYPTVKYDALGNLIRLRDSNVLNFNINLNEFGNKTSVSSCKYDTINELINYKDKIALEFRITNTNSENLFLGKNGNERTPGTNWVGFESILKSRNNSYNKTGEGAKYSITLTPEMIKQIRDYNKSNSYDDYNLTCENDGNICISNYLTQLRNNYGLKIYESEKRNVVEKRLNITNTNLGNWKKEGSDTYYIDSNGNKVTGWQQLSWDGGINWFYFEPDGKMVKSEWRLLYWKDKEDWYYFSSNGEMLTGWQELNWDNKLNWFYLEPEGRLKTLTGWQKMDADWYYFDSDGQVSTGWKNINDVWYYFDLSGKMLTGWQSRDGVWYYLEPSGQMTTGWRCADNICYYLSPSGAMLTGWQYIASNWHYFASNGVMLTGWQKIGDNWYYLNPSGVMLTGWQKIGDNWYYLEPSGQMVTGWKNINNNWYYLESSGQMTTGWKYIDNVWYYFENSGACTEGC